MDLKGDLTSLDPHPGSFRVAFYDGHCDSELLGPQKKVVVAGLALSAGSRSFSPYSNLSCVMGYECCLAARLGAVGRGRVIIVSPQHQLQCIKASRFLLASHFDVLYNGTAAQSDTFSSHKKSPARASPNDRANRRHRGRLRTVADGCGRSSQLRRTHLQPPDPQLINGNPSLRIRENMHRTVDCSCTRLEFKKIYKKLEVCSAAKL